MMAPAHPIGVVVIARNEGERLRRCLTSLASSDAHVVYVDSGSTDGSQELARRLSATVVELDRSRPFTAARARNAGFARLLADVPDVEFVQFVDGDCEVAPGWMARAVRELEGDPRHAVVCGRRRERHRERSIYNRLCDIEWDTPVGPARACGGDAMFRARAFRDVDGFDGDLIAGEEPELCARLRAAGWTVFRVDAEMTVHDAAMTRFGQWWRRAVRAGHCFAEGFALHGRAPERLWLKANASTIFWSLLLPAGVALTAPATRGWSLGLLAAYPVAVIRTYLRAVEGGMAPADARLYAPFCMIAKAPQLLGQLKYVWGRAIRRPSGLIEYKGAGTS